MLPACRSSSGRVFVGQALLPVRVHFSEIVAGRPGFCVGSIFGCRSASLFSFYGTACIDERIPLLQYSGALGNGGAAGVDFTRGVCILLSRSIRSANKNWEQRDQKSHT